MALGLNRCLIFLAALFMFKCSSEQNAFLPEISPFASPQPFVPFIAPSPMAPFINHTAPKLSGLCSLNFTASDSLIQTTSYNCWMVLAPVLANVMCCPQLEATLTILLGQSSKQTGLLALNRTHAKHCLSDIEQILVSQGATDVLNQICAIHPSNLTAASCPVKEVEEFENTLNSSNLLASCENTDPVKECCEQTCHNAIVEAAKKLALKGSDPSSNNSLRVNSCRNIVLRWLASKLKPSRAKEILRGQSNCKINRVCPLVFPHTKDVASSCGDDVSNQIDCCEAMKSYVSHLQKQTLITNLQALDCATSLGLKLQKHNITKNIYSLCHISLKDFSLQVASQVSGCLLPSLPSDAVFDKFSGISITCDLNDNIPAPWPSSSEPPASSCNKTVKIPALPAAASAGISLYNKDYKHYVTLISSVALMVLLHS